MCLEEREEVVVVFLDGEGRGFRDIDTCLPMSQLALTAGHCHTGAELLVLVSL